MSAPPQSRVVGILIRNSTPKQVDNWRAKQQQDLPTELERMGYGVKLYDEQGTSASGRQARPVLEQLKYDLRHGVITAVAVIEMSRLSRDRDGVTSAELRHILRKAKAHLYVGGRFYDLNDRGDVMQLKVAQAMAEDEGIQIRDRLWGGMLQRMLAEPVFRGRCPLGFRFRLSGFRRSGAPIWTIEIDPLDDEFKRDIVAYLLDHWPPYRIAADFNRHGRLRRQKNWRGETTGFRFWQATDISGVIKRPLYEGVIVPLQTADSDITEKWLEKNRHLYHYRPDLAWFTHEQRKYLLDLLAQRRHVPSRLVDPDHALSGLLVCPECGKPLWSAKRQRHNPPQPTLRCSSNGRGTGCSRSSVVERTLREPFLDLAADLLADLDISEVIRFVLEHRHDSQQEQALQVELDNLTAREAASWESQQEGDLSPEAGRLVRAEARQRRTDIRAALAKMEAERRRVQVPPSPSRDDLRQMLGALSEEQLSRLLRSIFALHSVVVDWRPDRHRSNRGWVVRYELTEEFAWLVQAFAVPARSAVSDVISWYNVTNAPNLGGFYNALISLYPALSEAAG